MSVSTRDDNPFPIEVLAALVALATCFADFPAMPVGLTIGFIDAAASRAIKELFPIIAGAGGRQGSNGPYLGRLTVALAVIEFVVMRVVIDA